MKTLLIGVALLLSVSGFAAEVDVSAAENVKPKLPVISPRLFRLTDFAENDFDIRDATAPTFERVVRTIRADAGPKKIAGEH